MKNENINDYIEKQRKEGVSDAAIKKAMISSGWAEDQVNAAFSGGNTSDFGGKLLGPGELLSRSFSILKSRFWTLVGIQLLPTLIFFIIGLIGALGAVAWGALNIQWNTASIIAIAVIVIVALVGVIYLSLWSQVALFQAILNAEEKIGLKEAFRRSKGKIGQFFWVSFLESLVVMGGFLLLIIPGVIFAVWFMFGNIMYVDQGVKGIAALSKSREYTRGMWWKIVGRMAVSILVAIGVYIVTGIIDGILLGQGEDGEGITIVSRIAGLIMGPFFTIYAVQLYKNIKSIKGDVSTEGKGTGWIKLFAVLGVVLIILIPVGMAAAFTAINPSKQLKLAQETQERADMMALKQALSRYYAENMSYPSTLAELVPNYMAEVPISPMGQEYLYSPMDDDYELCGRVVDDTGDTQCVSSTTVPESVWFPTGSIQPPLTTGSIYE